MANNIVTTQMRVGSIIEVDTASGPERFLVVAPGGPGASLVNLSNVLYVDKATAVAPADQVGNIEAPFATLAAGIAAAVALAKWCLLYVATGDYSAEVIAAMPSTMFGIAALNVPQQALTSLPVLLPALPAGCPDLAIIGCAYSSTEADQLTLADCTTSGDLTCSLLYSYESILGLVTTTTAVIVGGTLLSDITASGGLEARGTKIQGSCLLTNDGGGVDAMFTGCSWRNAAPVNIGNGLNACAITMRGCDFRKGQKVTLNGAGGTIDIDATSYGGLLAAGLTVPDLDFTLSLASEPHPSGTMLATTSINPGAVEQVVITVPGIPVGAAYSASTDVPLDVGLVISSIYYYGPNSVGVDVLNTTAAPISVAANITFRIKAV